MKYSIITCFVLAGCSDSTDLSFRDPCTFTAEAFSSNPNSPFLFPDQWVSNEFNAAEEQHAEWRINLIDIEPPIIALEYSVPTETETSATRANNDPIECQYNAETKFEMSATIAIEGLLYPTAATGLLSFKGNSGNAYEEAELSFVLVGTPLINTTIESELRTAIEDEYGQIESLRLVILGTNAERQVRIEASTTRPAAGSTSTILVAEWSTQ